MARLVGTVSKRPLILKKYKAEQGFIKTWET